MTSALTRTALLLLAAILIAERAASQQIDPRLERLDAATRPAVAALVDSARRALLPPEPLVQRALEGATKRASGDVIVAAVRRLALDLGHARDALGPTASPAELTAGAAALRAGASSRTLTELRQTRRDPLTMPLAVLADLVASGVPVDSAAAAVLALAARARDADLVEFRRAVERDIALGAPPAAATAAAFAATAADMQVNAGARSSAPAAPNTVRPAAAARHVRTASLAAATFLCCLRPSAAQTIGTVDVGISTVRYDGFLPSGAGSLTPAVTWERPGAVVTARGSYLRFESGRRSLQGLVAASLFTPPHLLPHRWRGEISFSAGGSSYAHFASFWHATAEARLHFVAAGRGAWIGGTGGRTSYGGVPRPVAVAGVGVWARRSWVTITASATRSMVGDTAYSDVGSTVHASRGRVGIDASLAARVSSQGAGHGVYGEASTTLSLGDRTALFVSGGRYPTDPVSGGVAGRYMSAGLRLRTALPRPRVLRDPQPLSRSPANGDGGAGFTARLDIQPAGDGTVRVVLYAPAAATVDVAGDFTDWRAVALRRAGEGTWECVLPMSSGVHRINVRVDGGRWTAPEGTTRVADEFGGEVGIVAVP